MKKYIAWNVNGLRACIGKGFMDFFNEADADVFCVGENKMQPEQMPVEVPGYHIFWNCADKKGYSGVTVFSKEEPAEVIYGIDGRYNDEGRVITLDFCDHYLISCYSPNVQPTLARMDYRMEYEDAMREWMISLAEKKPVIMCGDLNVAHQPIDLRHPGPNEGKAGYTAQEREKFSQLLEAGFADSFRYFYPDKAEQYTWWSYRANARRNNAGWRIDYFLVSEGYMEAVEGSEIYSDVMGSDHCPIGLTLR